MKWRGIPCFWRGHIWIYPEAQYRHCVRCKRHYIRLPIAPGKNPWVKVT